MLSLYYSVHPENPDLNVMFITYIIIYYKLYFICFVYFLSFHTFMLKKHLYF